MSLILNQDYGAFYEGYIENVKSNPMEAYELAHEEQMKLIESWENDYWDYAYAENKWTIKQLISHIIETERVMAYRALRISKNDGIPLPGYDEDLFVDRTILDHITPEHLKEEFELVRRSNYLLFKGFTSNQMKIRGVASDSPISVGALLSIITGHSLHHFDVIKERY